MLAGPRHVDSAMFQSILHESDCYGQLGYELFRSSDNLVVDFTSEMNDEGIIQASQIAPANSSSQQIRQGLAPSIESDMGPVSIHWKREEAPPRGKRLIWGIKEQFPFETAHWTLDDSAKLFPYDQDHQTADIRMVELFSGACGGWTAAAQFLNRQDQIPIRTLGIDRCFVAGSP